MYKMPRCGKSASGWCISELLRKSPLCWWAICSQCTSWTKDHSQRKSGRRTRNWLQLVPSKYCLFCPFLNIYAVESAYLTPSGKYTDASGRKRFVGKKKELKSTQPLYWNIAIRYISYSPNALQVIHHCLRLRFGGSIPGAADQACPKGLKVPRGSQWRLDWPGALWANANGRLLARCQHERCDWIHL